MRCAPLLLLALLGCHPKWTVVDGDGDGFTAAEGDCDDNDGGRHPGAEEVWYDGIDQDCLQDDDNDQDQDGVAVDLDCDDLDPTAFPGAEDAWYDGADSDCAGNDDFDADSDGYATALYPGEGGALGDDCNDGDPQVNPGASEVCDDLDNDCDAAIDGEDSSVDLETARTWYADTDADTYGDAGTATVACDQPDDYVLDDTDCDDAESVVNPGEAEACDGLDNDCDDDVDEGVTTTYYVDGDGDTYGDDDLTVELCAASDGYVPAGGDCDDTDVAINPGADERCATVGVDDNCDGAADEVTAVDVSTWYADTDGDTYGDPDDATPSCTQPGATVSNATDCDDTDADVNPGETEVCNGGVDDDCDAVADDDDPGVSVATRTTWYVDGDSDTYGKSSGSIARCAMPTGYAARSGDCDDAEAAISPAATEVCDGGVDNDCDTQADDADPSIDSGSQTTWYDDDDGDGYGDPATAVDLCLAPAGTVSDGSDCDDTSDLAHPGLTEVCNDELDNDCVDGLGTRDASAPSATCELSDGPLTDAAWTMIGSSLNTLGFSVFGGVDINKDGVSDVVTGNPGTSGGGSNAGSVTVFTNLDASLDPDSPASAAVTTAALTIDGGAAADRFGASVTGGVVAGKPWLVAGAPLTGAQDKGTLYLFKDPIATTDDAVADADLSITGGTNKDYLGWAATMGGDADGDAKADLLYSAPQNVNLCGFGGVGTASGAGFVVLLKNSTVAANSTTATATLTGTTAGDGAGFSLSWVDIDGDGLDDAAVGAPLAPFSGTAGAGKVYLLDSAALTGTVGLASSTAILSGVTALDALGASLSSGDADGDGYEDLLVGADGASSKAGVAYLFPGGASGVSTRSASAADASFTGVAASDGAGVAVSLLLDGDDDGKDEVVVGASKGDGVAADSGQVYLYLGQSFSGSYALSAADVTWDGLAATDRAGASLNGVGDINGDGRGDLLIGAYNYDGDGAASNTGAAHLFLGLGQ